MPYISVAELPPQPVSLACQHGMRTSARTWRALTCPTLVIHGDSAGAGPGRHPRLWFARLSNECMRRLYV
jgi:hypothetical protein